MERYQSGNFDDAVSRLLADRTVRELSGGFRREGSRWIDQAAVDDRLRRTAVVAAMTVELMATTFSQADYWQYVESRVLVEWACEQLRRLEPTEFERWFHLASTALLQGARDDGWLGGVSGVPTSYQPHPSADAHPRHGGLRFPNEARLKLAYLTSRSETTFLLTVPMPPAFLTKGSNRGRFETERGGDAARVKDTIQLLTALSGDAAVKHEARLRSGVARVMLDQPTEARADLEAALSSPDPAIRYVARLVLGAIEDHASRPLSALEHYRQAHQTIAASASSIALASLLYRLGRYSEAADVVAAFAQHEPPPDPWRLYGQRDYRFFPEFRAHMRQEVTRIR